jgi:hypothetical protein
MKDKLFSIAFWALNLALVAVASWAIFNLVNLWV